MSTTSTTSGGDNAMTDHNPTADDWRARITALCGADTIEAMLAWAARQGDQEHGWLMRVEWLPGPACYEGMVGVTAFREWVERRHRTDPAECLAQAIIAAVAMGEVRT